MSGVAVEFRGVSFVEPGAEPRVDDLAMTVGAGETLVLLGRSGSGKTTTLKLVNALLLPTRGVVRVGGESTASRDPVLLRRHTGYVIQEGGLFPHFDVERNVIFGSPEEVAARLAAFARASCSEVTLVLEPSDLSLGQLALLRRACDLAGENS